MNCWTLPLASVALVLAGCAGFGQAPQPPDATPDARYLNVELRTYVIGRELPPTWVGMESAPRLLAVLDGDGVDSLGAWNVGAERSGATTVDAQAAATADSREPAKPGVRRHDIATAAELFVATDDPRRFDRLQHDRDRALGLRFELDTSSTSPRSVRSQTATQYLHDHELEITSSSMVSKPIYRHVMESVELTCQATLIEPDSVELDFVVTLEKLPPSPSMERWRTTLGSGQPIEIELPRLEVRRHRSRVRIARRSSFAIVWPHENGGASIALVQVD